MSLGLIFLLFSLVFHFKTIFLVCIEEIKREIVINALKLYFQLTIVFQWNLEQKKAVTNKSSCKTITNVAVSCIKAKKNARRDLLSANQFSVTFTARTFPTGDIGRIAARARAPTFIPV